ncbi:ABC transporter substrate-binding protein [Klebsiella grimontii]
MRKHLYSGMALGVLFSGQALANEKLTLVLDWYINPDHAPIVVAEQIGAFKEAGLDVKIVPPSDPALPPRLVAARQADLAITYQPQVHFFADEGLPLVRVGTLINSPLNTVIALDKSIKSPADLQGKKVGYSVSGIEQATLATMAQHAHIDPSAVNSGSMHGQKVRIVGEKASLEWWDEQPNQLRYEIQGEPVRILERGMPYLDPLALQDDRIGGGHPEGLFEAWSNLYRRFAIAMDATDRRDSALLENFWYPDAKAGALGVHWVESCVRSADNGASWVEFH